MIPGKNIIGKKARSVVNVPEIRGALNSAIANIIALSVFNHCLTRS